MPLPKNFNIGYSDKPLDTDTDVNNPSANQEPEAMTKKQRTEIAKLIRQKREAAIPNNKEKRQRKKRERIRKAAGITQQEAAARAGVSQSYWSEVERGVWSLSVETLMKVAKALGVKEQELLPK